MRLCANACACAGGCELMFEERKSEKVCVRESQRQRERVRESLPPCGELELLKNGNYTGMAF